MARAPSYSKFLEVSIDQRSKERVQKALEQMPAKLAKKMENKAARQAGYRYRDSAKRYAPRDTGELIKNFKVRALKKTTRWQRKYLIGVKVLAEDRGADNNTYHALIVEYGTSRQRAQPFFRPAIASAQFDVEKIYAAAIRQGLRESHRV